MKLIKEKMNKKIVIGTILIFSSVLIIASIIWGNRTFSVKTLPQIIFHTKVPMDGTDNGIYTDWFLLCVPVSIVITILINAIIFYIYKPFKSSFQQILKRLPKYFYKISIFCLVFSLVYTLNNYNVFGYVMNITQSTDLYEKYYVEPSTANITFPNGKRNSIHIYLESLENTYLTSDFGGAKKENYMPELGKLAKENINFSNTDKIGGSLTLDGTQWTIAAMVSKSAGIPLALPLTSKVYDESSAFLPGSYGIGEVLQEHGYNQELLMGSDAKFGLTTNFYKQHGEYKVADYYDAKEQGRIAEDYFVFWGYEDKKLFDFAKEDILSLASQNEPFNMEMVTIDTHTPDGYLCEQCPTTFKTQYENVIACQSKQVNDFVEWIKQQAFYENTTIIITGDHNSMASKFFDDVDEKYIRTPYNVIINPAITTTNTKNRQFSTMDWYPTILVAMGANIEGERLGLGTNLFSDKKTIIEEIGFDTVNQEVQKKSTFYDNKLLENKE